MNEVTNKLIGLLIANKRLSILNDVALSFNEIYNEKKNILSLIEKVFSIDKNFHILIVDDNSPDGTANIVKELQPKYNNLFLEERPGKAGLGTAYKFGFNWALDRNYDNIIQMDADLSHDPKEIKNFINMNILKKSRKIKFLTNFLEYFFLPILFHFYHKNLHM